MGLFDGLDLLETFVVVAEELNFRRSAERLHVDQSALSRRIQKLEHLLGFALLERTTREVGLTLAGRNFYNDNKGILNTYAKSVEVAQAISRGHSGVLTVAYMDFAALDLMPMAVSRYRLFRPHVAVNLRYVGTQGQKILLTSGDIDVGYLIGPLRHDDLETITLSSDRLCVVSPRDHPINLAPTITIKDIAAYPLILGDMREWDFYRWQLFELFGADGIVMQVAFQAANTLAILGLVRAGLGITILPESLALTLNAGLRARPVDHKRFAIDTLIAWRREDQSGLVRDFIATATKLATLSVSFP